MKAQLITATCTLIISAYGIAPVMAESFNERGLDWAVDSPMSTAAYISEPQTLAPDGSFASSWGSGITPSQYKGPSSPSTRLTTGQSCELAPRIGFAQKNHFPTC